MSFLRIATLCAAITSLLAFVANLANMVTRLQFLLHAEPQILFSFFIYPLQLLALTAFFTALFMRQKG